MNGDSQVSYDRRETNISLSKRVEGEVKATHIEEGDHEVNHNRILIAGLGQIGLPVAKYVKDRGFDVYGFDINENAIEAARISGIKTTDSFDGFGIYILCVPTHKADDMFKPQTDSLFSVVKRIGKEATSGSLISIESTIPRGTSRKVFELVNRRLHVAHVPHRWYISEQETHGVNQIRVAGGISDCCLSSAAKFYSGPTIGGRFNHNVSSSLDLEYSNSGNVASTGMQRLQSYSSRATEASSLIGCSLMSLGIPLHMVTDIEIAEVSKIAENAHRFLQIAFAEDLYLYCRNNGINFFELRNALNTKWNVEILEPREGIGGHCLPKDTRIFLESSKSTKSKILKAAMAVDNDYRYLRLGKGGKTHS
jgi:UDP-N-acetyl-D-mannosaminuronic acid dehydrogenase